MYCTHKDGCLYLTCRFGDGLVEDDVSGMHTREPLRTCCTNLSKAIWALNSNRKDPRIAPLRTAVLSLQRAASSERAAAADDQLDHALDRLVVVLQAAERNTKRTRLDNLELLVAALQALSMTASSLPSTPDTTAIPLQTSDSNPSNPTPIDKISKEIRETSTLLRSIAQLCDIEPVHTTATSLAQDVTAMTESYIQKLPPGFFDSIFNPQSLTDAQQATLHQVNSTLFSEYTVRRRMLIERVKATLLSFSWSLSISGEGEETRDVAMKAQEERESALKKMRDEPYVEVSDVYRCSLGQAMEIMERPTSAHGSGGVPSRVKEVLMGSVPDRGGRTEGRSRAADMPAWAVRKAAGGRGHRGGKGGRRGGGPGGGGEGVKKGKGKSG